MEEEVEWMKDREKKILIKKREEEGGGKADASLWSPVCCSCHPLFITLFLMLQSGISHCVSPEREGKGKRGRKTEYERRMVIKSYAKGEVGRNKGKAGMTEDVNCKVITRLTLSKVNLHE